MTTDQIQVTDTKEIEGDDASCDGGGGALGHPRVYLTFGPKNQVYCPYCSKRFVRKAGAVRGPGAH